MTTALIVGGGIAGPATAMALHKAGIRSVVHEAYDVGADEAGAFVTLMENGLDALRAIDALEPVLERSFPAAGVDFMSSSGRALGHVTLGDGPSGDATPRTPRTLRRSALYRVLYEEAARRGIPVEHGKRFTGATATPGGRVTASFADGSTAEGDLLIGADGLRSTTRQVIDPDAPGPRYTGLNTVFGYTRDSSAPAAPDGYRMIYGKRSFVGYTTAPDGETWWFVNMPGPELTRADITGTTSDQWRERLLALFAQDTTPAADLVAATGPTLISSNTYDLPRLPVWQNGTMVVIGDAAHAAAHAGQGGSMALEDSVILAKCLRDVPGIPQALKTYEHLRRDRVERVVALSARMGDDKMPSRLKRVLRDAMMPRLLERGRPGTPGWLAGHRIDWQAPVGAA
ncbi:FAD-dependent monooxygenase [Streptomyces sp. NPDC052496]|uniref:FAD-dependent oxidoreductase n=1 Tax=Streptomyces sp. NPDC052496 TaxID=3154951 RepID=UPI00343AA6E9